MLIYWIFTGLVSAVIAFLVQIILHELGHLIGGLLTGWQLVHLQVHRLVLVREERLKLKIISSIGFQCIMNPKSEYQKSNLYTMGGVLMNLLLTIIGLMGIVFFIVNPFIVIVSMSLLASGIAMLVTNGIPSTKTVCNDMSCYRLLRKDDRTRYYHNAQLMIAKQLSKGKTYCEMSKKLFYLTENVAENDILCYQSLLEYYYHLDKDEYAPAREAIKKAEHGKNVSSGVEKIIRLELLYHDLLLDILSNENKAIRKSAYVEGIENYIKKYEVKGDIHSLRVRGLWESYHCYSIGKLSEAVECLERIKSKMRSIQCLYPGEANFCIDQVTGIRNMLRRDLSSGWKAVE